MTVFLFILLALGVARVSWFITEDHLPLIAKPREAIVNRNPDGNLAYLVNCWWCVSVYTGAGAAAFSTWVLEAPIYHLENWKTFLVLWPAFSMAAVLIMSVADTTQAYGSDN